MSKRVGTAPLHATCLKFNRSADWSFVSVPCNIDHGLLVIAPKGTQGSVLLRLIQTTLTDISTFIVFCNSIQALGVIAI